MADEWLPPMPNVFSDVISGWPVVARQCFKGVRSIIYQTLQPIADVTLTETLKWGEPSWLPERPRIGSTLRVAWQPSNRSKMGIFVNCNTHIAYTMRELYPTAFEYDGNRALRFPLDAPIPHDAIAHCAAITLTYHRKSA